MSLPQLATMKFSMKMNDQEWHFRPFLVKEEKALLIAMESNDLSVIQRAVLDIVDACFETTGDISKMPYFEVEKMFLALRAKSVAEIVTLNYSHKGDKNFKGEDCDHVTSVVVNLENVEIKYPEKPFPKIIKIDETYSIKLRYPTILDVTSMVEKQTIDELEMVARCIESVFDADTEHMADDLEDTKRFVSELTTQQYAALIAFFKNMPYLHQTINYKCGKCGQEETVDLRGLEDFFA